MSFAVAPHSKNLLGLMGHTLGWAFHAVFGLSSYLLVIYCGWMGWRLLFAKSLHFLWLKHIYVAVNMISLCLLLSLIEGDAPHFAVTLHQLFYPGLWENHLDYYLGGSPFFYLYEDLPTFNLRHVFNTIGVALIFSSTFIASFLFLFKIRLVHVCQRLIDALKRGIERERLQRTQQEPLIDKDPKKNDKKEENKPESDFFRFVKLRIPKEASQENTSKASPLSTSSSDLLAIRPEKNPKERPSLSRKEQDDRELEKQEDLSASRSKTLQPSASMKKKKDEKPLRKRAKTQQRKVKKRAGENWAHFHPRSPIRVIFRPTLFHLPLCLA